MTELLLIFAIYLGVECGASWPWSHYWQEKKSWYSALPEWVSATFFAILAMAIYVQTGLADGALGLTLAFIFAWAFSFLGINAGTWPILSWGDAGPNPDRGATLFVIVKPLAKLFKTNLGEKKFSWIYGIVKGTILTLPAGGLGGVFFATPYWLAYRLKLKGRAAAIVKEGGSFAGVFLYYLFIYSLVF